jgi:lipoate-protein ligase B
MRKHKARCGCTTNQFKPIKMCGTHATQLIEHIAQLRTELLMKEQAQHTFKNLNTLLDQTFKTIETKN